MGRPALASQGGGTHSGKGSDERLGFTSSVVLWVRHQHGSGLVTTTEGTEDPNGEASGGMGDSTWRSSYVLPQCEEISTQRFAFESRLHGEAGSIKALKHRRK